MNKVRYLIGEEDKDFYIGAMKKFLEQKRELDKFLEKLVTPLIKNKNLKILDTCCGIGHLIYFLNKISPSSQFVGIDKKRYLIEEARKLCGINNPNITFKTIDVYKLSKYFKKEFDITINWKTLSWLSKYEKAVEEMMKVTKKFIFLSSLFYEGDIDFEIKVREYHKEAGKRGFSSYYNTYSLPRFKKFCYQLGAKKIKVYDFEIPIDLPKPPLNQMGTYTLKLENGKRLQISGVVLMNWKIIQIEI